MANFCPNCGSALYDTNAAYCPTCGAAINSSAYTNSTAYTGNTMNNVEATVAGALGTLVAVTIAGGITRQLYYRGGRYFLDPMCHNPFVGRIMGPHRPLPPPHPMGGPRPPMGGGPHGPMGGPRGPMGGPHGGPRGGGPRGHR